MHSRYAILKSSLEWLAKIQSTSSVLDSGKSVQTPSRNISFRFVFPNHGSLGSKISLLFGSIVFLIPIYNKSDG